MLFATTFIVNAQFGTMPAGKPCITKITKNADGERNANFTQEYNCTQFTKSGIAKYSLKLGTTNCDETSIITVGSTLNAEGSFIQRKDGFATFAGKFNIQNAAGAVVIEGNMETIEMIGILNNECGKFLDGWIEGRNTTGLIVRGNLQLNITPVIGNINSIKLRGDLFAVQIKP